VIHNPWYAENTANYYRQQVQDEMRQIRLEEMAMKAKDLRATSSRSQPTVLRAARHAALVLAKAVVVVLLG
jgi:hypothetical protein